MPTEPRAVPDVQFPPLPPSNSVSDRIVPRGEAGSDNDRARVAPLAEFARHAGDATPDRMGNEAPRTPSEARPLPADGGHAARGLDEPGLADVVLELLAPHGVADDLLKLG